MKRTLFPLLSGAMCALLLGAACAAAATESAVVGSYDYRETVIEDRGPGIRLLVRLFNRGDEPIADADVTLEDSLARGIVLGSFGEVNVGARALADLDGLFVLPEEELDHLRKGGRPRLYLRSGEGEESTRLRILLQREPLVGEEGR